MEAAMVHGGEKEKTGTSSQPIFTSKRARSPSAKDEQEKDGDEERDDTPAPEMDEVRLSLTLNVCGTRA